MIDVTVINKQDCLPTLGPGGPGSPDNPGSPWFPCAAPDSIRRLEILWQRSEPLIDRNSPHRLWNRALLWVLLRHAHPRNDKAHSSQMH